jgi:uncharacterized protein YukE
MDQVASFGTSVSARETLRATLERQEEWLTTLVGRFEQLRATAAPPRLRDEWHGVAGQRYAEAADRLRRDLEHVAEHLHAALTDTRRALTTLAQGG